MVVEFPAGHLADAAFALTPSSALDSSQAPALVTLTPAAAGDYVQSQFTFQRSANVALTQETVNAVAAQTAGSTAGVGATNTIKGNRSYGGTVGALSNPPKACQNTGTTPITTAPDAATVNTCTF